MKVYQGVLKNPIKLFRVISRRCDIIWPHHVHSSHKVQTPSRKTGEKFFSREQNKSHKAFSVPVTFQGDFKEISHSECVCVWRAQCWPSLWTLQATAVIRAAPFPLPSSDFRKVTWHCGAKSCKVSCMMMEKLWEKWKRTQNRLNMYTVYI